MARRDFPARKEEQEGIGKDWKIIRLSGTSSYVYKFGKGVPGISLPKVEKEIEGRKGI